MVVNMGFPMRYIIPPSMKQPPPPPVRTSEYPPSPKKQNYAPSVRTNQPRKVQYEDEDEEEEEDPSDDEYDEPVARRKPASRSMKKTPVQPSPPAPVGEEESEEEKKPKDPTSRLKKLVKKSKDFKNLRKRLTARGEVYRPNRNREQPSELVSQEGGAFPALLIPALTALAPFAGEVAKDVYNAIKRKIKGEGSVRQKMGRRLKTKQERLDFVVELLKKHKL